MGQDQKGKAVRDWDKVGRWTEHRTLHGTQRAWFVETGTLAWDCEYRNDSIIRGTEWRKDGTVWRQAHRDVPGLKIAPPWWWGIEDQTEPTAPWWEEEKP